MARIGRRSRRCVIVRRDGQACVTIDLPQARSCLLMALASSGTVPSNGLGIVRGHTFAALVTAAQRELRVGITTGGCAP